jgi:hypothetical protein
MSISSNASRVTYLNSTLIITTDNHLVLRRVSQAQKAIFVAFNVVFKLTFLHVPDPAIEFVIFNYGRNILT